MKIFEFHGGLGNQIFEYIYLQYLKMKFPNDVFYSYFFDKQHWIHNGFELDKWFEVEKTAFAFEGSTRAIIWQKPVAS